MQGISVTDRKNGYSQSILQVCHMDYYTENETQTVQLSADTDTFIGCGWNGTRKLDSCYGQKMEPSVDTDSKTDAGNLVHRKKCNYTDIGQVKVGNGHGLVAGWKHLQKRSEKVLLVRMLNLGI